MQTRVIYAAIVLHSIISVAGAQSVTWMPSSGPGGGRVFGLAELPTGTVLAALENAGILRSTDAGLTWKATSWYTGTFRSASTTSDGTVFFAGSSGLIRSTDDGMTWDDINLGDVNGSLEAIDISEDDHIYVGSFYNHVGRSTDLGETWQILPIAFSYWPTPVREVFCYGDSIVFVFGDDDGLFVSGDGGSTWEFRGFAGFSLNDGGLGRLNDGTLVLGSAGGVRHSLDTGRTWKYFYPPGDPTDPVWGYRWDNASLSLAYKMDSLYLSQNHGISWTAIVPPGRESYYLGSMVLTDNTILAGTNGDGVYRSTDDGNSWSDASDGMDGTTTWNIFTTRQGRMYASSDRGVFLSTDGGSTWHLQRTCPPNVGAALQADDDAIIAATQNGLFRSADGGDNFVQVQAQTYWSALSRDSSGRLYAGRSSVVMVSTDNGVTWDHSDSVRNKVWRLLSIDGTTYASIYGNGIRRTTDGGQSWHAISDSLPHYNIYGLASMEGDLYAGAPGGQVALLEAGSTIWSARTSLPSSCWTLLSAPDEALFAGTTTGVFRSTDHGASWVPFGDGLSDRRVYSLELRPDGRLVAGLANGSAHMSSHPVVSSALEIDGPTGFALEQNFPNPFNPSTEISYSLQIASRLSLRVFDLLGREVALLVDRTQFAGRYTVTLNSENLASGMYFYTLEARSVDGKGFVKTKKMVLLK